MNKPTISLIIITILFIVWSAFFIFNSSFLAIDGTRYFSLFDDAMISMRYAWNLSHGIGLVWNEGERVEGFTNLLMTLYMSLLTGIFEKKYAVLAVQISGIFFLLINAYFFFKIGEQLIPKEKPSRFLILTLFFLAPLTYYPLLYWTLMGMEVGLLAAFIAAAIYFVFRVHNQFTPIIPLLLGLAFLTRPDAAIVIAVILLFRAYLFMKVKRLFLILWDGLMVAIFILGITGFRLIYYGSQFPNTYTLKMTGMDLWFRITENGLNFITPFLNSLSVLLFLCLLALLLRFSINQLFFSLLFATSVLYQIYVGGDPWLYWRQMAPYVPYLYFIIIPYLIDLTQARENNTQLTHTKKPTVITTGLLAILILLSNQSFYRELFLLTRPFQVKNNEYNVNTAIILNKILKPNSSVAVFWAGAIPYFTTFQAVDMLGKSDKYIASLDPDISGSVSWNGMKSVPGHNKYDLNYSIMKKQPTYIQGYRWGQQNLSQLISQKYVVLKVKDNNLMLLKTSPNINWKQARLINGE